MLKNVFSVALNLYRVRCYILLLVFFLLVFDDFLMLMDTGDIYKLEKQRNSFDSQHLSGQLIKYYDSVYNCSGLHDSRKKDKLYVFTKLTFSNIEKHFINILQTIKSNIRIIGFSFITLNCKRVIKSQWLYLLHLRAS